MPIGTPVAVAGHDHLCALLGAGIVAPGAVLDSIGTAESLLGVLPRLDLGEAAQSSGLSIAPQVVANRWCWLGGTPAAGGSIEWLRQQLGEEPLSYERIDALVGETGVEPSNLLYVPYLAGSGAPNHNLHVRAVLAGLSASTGRGDLAKAVLEGTAFEAESIRRAAERLTGTAISEVIAVGGGSRNQRWLQIRADVSGCTYRTSSLPDAALLGAAAIAALGLAVLPTVEQIVTIAQRYRDDGTIIVPDMDRHDRYRWTYTNRYEAYVNFVREDAAKLLTPPGPRRNINGG